MAARTRGPARDRRPGRGDARRIRDECGTPISAWSASTRAAVSAVWSVAFERLAADDPPALALLTLLAWLGPEPFPLHAAHPHPDLLPAALAGQARTRPQLAERAATLRRRALGPRRRRDRAAAPRARGTTRPAHRRGSRGRRGMGGTRGAPAARRGACRPGTTRPGGRCGVSCCRTSWPSPIRPAPSTTSPSTWPGCSSTPQASSWPAANPGRPRPARGLLRPLPPPPRPRPPRYRGRGPRPRRHPAHDRQAGGGRARARGLTRPGGPRRARRPTRAEPRPGGYRRVAGSDLDYPGPSTGMGGPAGSSIAWTSIASHTWPSQTA